MVLFSLNRLSRGLFQSLLGRQFLCRGLNFSLESFSTKPGLKKTPKLPFKYVAVGIPLTALGAGYGYYKFKKDESVNMSKTEILQRQIKPPILLDSVPNVPIARKMQGVRDDLNLHLILFQYPTCPFCCKVRAFLDYYGLPYDIVEVDPVLRQQTKWTNYKKVPILLAKTDEGYQQLNDSTMIISVLKTFLFRSNQKLKEIVHFYPTVEIMNEKGEVKAEILNKYFLMYQESLPKNKTAEIIEEEKVWREWADNSLVHVLSPNIYRTFDESVQAFKWFSEVGEWERLFPSWERNIIIYIGAFAMWIIGKRLKKRHQLLDDERESLYVECKTWMKAISEKKATFMGGSLPNLADLAVYGVLSSIEGCLAFDDLLENTKIANWYYPMKEAVNSHAGKKEIFH